MSCIYYLSSPVYICKYCLYVTYKVQMFGLRKCIINIIRSATKFAVTKVQEALQVISIKNKEKKCKYTNTWNEKMKTFKVFF